MDTKDLVFIIFMILALGTYASIQFKIPLFNKVGEGVLYQNVLHQSLWEKAYTINIDGKQCIMARPVFGSICCERYDPEPFTRYVGSGGGYYSGTPTAVDWDTFTCKSRYGCDIELPTLRKIDVEAGDPIEPKRCCIDYKIFSASGDLKESSNRCESGTIHLNNGDRIVLSSIMCIYSVYIGHEMNFDDWFIVGGRCALTTCTYGRTWGYYYTIREHDVAFYAYVPGAPAGIIAGTRGCYYQDLLKQKPELKEQPPKTIADALKPADLKGDTIDWNSLPLSAETGTCNLYVDHWEPSLGINFQWAESVGPNEVCMVEGTRSAIRKMMTVDVGGTCYAIPGDVVRTVDCCPGKNNCAYGFYCDAQTFTCVPQSMPGTIPCNSVWDCPNQGKETCQATMNGFELISGWKCDYSKPQTIGGKQWAGTCVEISKRDVECCPPSQGCGPDEYCSVTYGYKCVSVSPAPSSCPYECCDERMVKTFNFKYKPCPTGYYCYAGNCVTKPPVPPATCGNGICEPNESPEICPEDCKPGLKLSWAKIIAVISAFLIGFAMPEILRLNLSKNGKIIMGTGVGLLLSVVAYELMLIPWYVYVAVSIIIIVIYVVTRRLGI